jgi:chorismate dehydratase
MSTQVNESLHRLLITPYLNTRAFVHYGAPAGCDLQALAPREAIAAITNGSALGGVVPVGGLRQIDHLVNYIGAYGIGCAGPVDSVMFFSHHPFDAFDRHSTIRLTTESMTSVRLLYLLFAYRNGGTGELPVAVPQGIPADGELVIGDRALHMRNAGQYPYVVDLSDAWFQYHRLPMVFARWVIRKDAPSAMRATILAWLAEFAVQEPELLDQTARLDGAQAGLNESAARHYLDRIRTVLRTEDLRGQRIYERDLARHRYFDQPNRICLPTTHPAQVSI